MLSAAAVAPLAAAHKTPPAQNLYIDPFVLLSINGTRLKRDFVLDFGSIAQGAASITKTISLSSSQGNLPGFGAVSEPGGYAASIVHASDPRFATMVITFTPTTPGKANGTIVFPVEDGSGRDIAINVTANVLPTASVQISRIDMARLPAIAGGSLPKGVAHVQFYNNGPLNESGEIDVGLYASTSATFNAAGSLFLGTGNADLTLKSYQTKKISVRFSYPIPPTPGNYYIFAVADGPTLVTAAGSQYLLPYQEPILPPEINLSGVSTDSPLPIKQGKSRITIPIANSGNVRANAAVSLSLFTETAGSNGIEAPVEINLGNFVLDYSIAAGKGAIRSVVLNQRLPADELVYAEITAIHQSVSSSVLDISTVPETFTVR